MPTEFKLPELGENVTAGDVVRVLVAAGDTIAKDQPVVELETDKATIEVPSSVAGTVKDIAVKTGDRVNVGQVVLTVEEGARGAEKAEGTEKAEKAEGVEKAEARKAEEAGKADLSAEARGAKAEQPETAVDEGGMSQNAGQ